MSRQLDSYVRASVPDVYRVLGLQLKPFCLGHLFLMHRFDCAFASEEGTDAGISDFLLGLAICSRSYEEFIEFIRDEKAFEAWTSSWGKQVSKAIRRDKRFDVIEKMGLFQNYMKDSIRIPKYFEGDNSSETQVSGAHWTQSVLLVLTSELGFTQSEALNMPLSKALADYFKWAEKNGLVTLMSDDELEIVEELEKTQNANH